MNITQWGVVIYCLTSLLTLFNKGIRNLYLSVLDGLYDRFIRLNKKVYKGKYKDYIYCIFYCIVDLFEIFFYFILAPVIILYHLPRGGYKFHYSVTPYWKIKPTKPINKEYLNPSFIIQIKIKKDIPFIPDKQQVIYFEDFFNKELNNYISNKYDKICSLFREEGYSFIYLPKVIYSLSIEKARYINPSINEETTTFNNLASKDIIDEIITFIDTPFALKGGLLRYKKEEDNYYIFSYYQFSNLDESEIWEQIRAYLSTIGENNVLYSASPDHPYIENPDDNADYDFDSESKKLINEIKERVEILKQKGINEMILKSILSIDSVELSRLVITNEYKIFLTDYNNLEITMYPLPKAVYFLFLNHPEGILFKHLPNYRDELIAIYKKVSGRENIEDMEKSINDVVNPTLNSINEKCSRIREAFIRHFDEAIAKNYFITGDRATPKKINLNRSLVILEEIQIKVDVKKTPFKYVKYEHPNNKYSLENTILEDDLPF